MKTLLHNRTSIKIEINAVVNPLTVKETLYHCNTVILHALQFIVICVNVWILFELIKHFDDEDVYYYYYLLVVVVLILVLLLLLKIYWLLN